MYSLVSSAVLAADLVRHPHASRLADTLDRVLALTLQEACSLREPADPEVRRKVLAACSASPRVASELRHLLGEAGGERPSARGDDPGEERQDRPSGQWDAPGEGPVAERALSGAVLRLEEALLGSLDDLHALVLREEPVRSLPPDAVQVVLDVLTAAWAGPDVALRDVQLLVTPWERALDPVPPALPERPWSTELRDLLDEVPRRTRDQWRVSATRQRVSGRSLRWSEALHTASKAAWGAGRLTDVARAQLAGTRALALAHTGVSPYAAARVLTAAVQAVCTQDLIDSGVRDALWADWEAGSAPR